MEILVLGVLTAVGFILVMNKIGLSKFLKFEWQTDLVITAVIAMLFVGTFTGMATGIVAGIAISLFLTLARKFKKWRRRF